MDITLLMVVKERGVSKCAMNSVLVRNEASYLPSALGESRFTELCFAVSRWGFCVMSESVCLSLHTICTTVVAFSSPVVLWEM